MPQWPNLNPGGKKKTYLCGPCRSSLDGPGGLRPPTRRHCSLETELWRDMVSKSAHHSEVSGGQRWRLHGLYLDRRNLSGGEDLRFGDGLCKHFA